MLSTKKKIAFSLAVILILLVLSEGAAAVVVWWLRAIGKADICRASTFFAHQLSRVKAIYQASYGSTQVDPELGWRPRTGYRSADININAQGLRGSRTYAPARPPGILRVAAFGDSLVFGYEMADGDCWPAAMERLFPEMEVLNYGVLGYGLDQAYLRYKAEGQQLAPEIVVIGCTPGANIRCTGVYGPFIADSGRSDPLTKPRFLLDGQGGLILFPNPMRSQQELERALRERKPIAALGRYDETYRPCVYVNPLYDYSAMVRLLCWLGSKVETKLVDRYRQYKGGLLNPSAESFKVVVEILDRFSTEVKSVGATPVVVLWAEPATVERSRRGQPPTYQPLRDVLGARGIAYLDTADAFRDTPGRWQAWFHDAIHFSPSGNRIVAEWLGRSLRDRARQGGQDQASMSTPRPEFYSARTAGE
jgi:lysophospholipase L1-like esterase